MKKLPQEMVLANAKNIQHVDWIASIVPRQFQGAICAAWYCVGRVTDSPRQQAYFALVMQQNGADRCLAMIHFAGDDKPSTRKFATLNDTKEWVQRMLSERTVIARFTTFN